MQGSIAKRKFIGGRGIPGQTAVSGPWIWSEETGFKVLCENTDGNVTDVNDDGTLAVGWTGQSAWIWTEKEGFCYLNEYVAKLLGKDSLDFHILSASDLSSNNRYVCGSCLSGETQFAYVLDLMHNVGIEEMEAVQVKVAIYPNPASEEIHVDLPFDSSELNTTLTLVSMNGQVVRQLNTPNASNVIDIRDLSRGIYVLDVNANGRHKAFKVIVK